MRRLARILLNAARTISLLLAVLALALWIAARTGYRWAARYAPEDGRLWSVRSEPRTPDGFLFFCVAPWPHPPIREADLYPRNGSPPGFSDRVLVLIGDDPRAPDTSVWGAPGLAFRRSRQSVRTQVGPTLDRRRSHDEPVWAVRISAAY
jgi:hypothetical protein